MSGFVENRLSLFENFSRFPDAILHGFVGGVTVKELVDSGHSLVDVGNLRVQLFQALNYQFLVHDLMVLWQIKKAQTMPQPLSKGSGKPYKYGNDQPTPMAQALSFGLHLLKFTRFL